MGNKTYLPASTAPIYVSGATFEPFGVMVYEKRAACMFRCANSNLFKMLISGPKRPIAVGVGTEERFDELDIVLSMRLNIYRIFAWADVPVWIYVVLPVMLFFAFAWGVERAYKAERVRYLSVTAFICSVILSSVYFATIMLYLGTTSTTSMIIHVFLPAIICLPLYYVVYKADKPRRWIVASCFVATFFYALFLVWGDVFYFAPIYCAAGLASYVRSREFKGEAYKLRQRVPGDNEVMTIA